MEEATDLAADGLPPYGGSGLKCTRMWRNTRGETVSLHAEGVD